MRMRFVAVMLWACVVGCAGVKERVEPRQALWNEAGRFVYPRPIEQVWPQVVSFVSSEGYPHRKSAKEFFLVTEWRNDMQESRVASSVSRLYVEGHRVSDGSSAVRIFKQTIFTGNKGGVSARENRGGLPVPPATRAWR